MATIADPGELPVQGTDESLSLVEPGPATGYLQKLLKSIATMLSYANTNGIPLPDDLNKKVGELWIHPDVQKYAPRISFDQ